MYLIIFFVLLFTIYLLYFEHSDNIDVKSSLDENFYSVRDLPNAQDASNLLSEINNKIEQLVLYLYNNRINYPDHKTNIDLLYKKYKNLNLSENPKYNNGSTSYSIQKKRIVLCLRDKNNSLHNINLIMYVVIHELAHVASPVYDNHGDEFKKTFNWLSSIAQQINLYSPNEFKSSKEYCGLKI